LAWSREEQADRLLVVKKKREEVLVERSGKLVVKQVLKTHHDFVMTQLMTHHDFVMKQVRSNNSPKKLATPEGNSQLGSNCPNSKAPENSNHFHLNLMWSNLSYT